MKCEHQKPISDKNKNVFCTKIGIDVPLEVCSNTCKNGPWAEEQRSLWKEYEEINRDFFETLRPICMECEYFKSHCATGEFCLLRTRQVSLFDIWRKDIGCPEGKWELSPNPSLNDVIKRDTSKDDILISIIVLARDEEFLKPTLENLIERAEGSIEIICVLDGPTNYPILEHELVTYIKHEEPHGRRPSTNEAVQKAKGVYLFHVDAHVLTYTQGYDLLFKEACQDHKTMVIPNLDKLITGEWRGKGRRMGHKYITHKMKDAWSSTKSQEVIEPTITGNGMGWFLSKDYFLALGGCDESYGKIWGNFGLEWAIKVWLSDPDGRGAGQVLLHKNIVFAHMWKNKVGYSTAGAGGGRSRLWEWVEGKGKNQVRDFSFFEEEFSHLIPFHRGGTKNPLIVNQVTVIMNTNGLYPHLMEEAIESFLRQNYKHKHLIIVCTHPSGLRLHKEYNNITILNVKPFKTFPEQIAYAIRQVKTKYWCVMDSDDIFFPDHITQMIEGLKKAKQEGIQNPFYVKVPVAWEQRGDKVKERGAGWWCCLYEKMDDASINLALKKHSEKYNTPNSFDLVIRGLKMWSQYVMKGASPTVLHRIGIAFHIGFSQKNPNRYQEGLEQAASLDLPILEPKWNQDYYGLAGKEQIINVYSNNHLGDALTMEPGLRNIREHNPSAKIHVYTKWPELFKNHPDIDYAGLSKDCPGITYKLRISKRTHLCTWLDQVTGYKTDETKLTPHIYLDDIQRASIHKFDIDWSRPVVAFSTRTFSTSKRWDKGKWLHIVDWVRGLGFQTLQLGKKERKLHTDYDLINKTNVIEVAALLEKCKLVVSIDHGLPHMAAALGTKAVVLFGPGMPIEAEHKGLTFPVETNVCRKCRFKKRIGRKCPDGNAICMHSITVEQVKRVIIKALSKGIKNGQNRCSQKQVV